MTYQQFPPAGQQPVVQQPGQPFGGSPLPGARRTSLIAIGALLLVAGLIAGVVMLLASSSNYDEGARNLARAPIGCTTSLEFDEAGTYFIYVETTGTVGELRGDCPNADTDYDSDPDDVPDVEIVLVDDDGDEVDLDADSSADYDAGGFVGRSVASVEIDGAGDYELTATSDEDEIAVAVGRNPKEAAATLRTSGIGAMALGVVIGGLLIIVGLRRKPASGTPTPGPGAGVVSEPGPGNAAPFQQAPFQQTPFQGPLPGQTPVAPGPGGFPPAVTGPLTPPPPPAPPTAPPGPPTGGWPAPPAS